MVAHEFRWTYNQIIAIPGVVDYDRSVPVGTIRLYVEKDLDADALRRYLEPMRLVGYVLEIENLG